jgi:hypothetical protein
MRAPHVTASQKATLESALDAFVVTLDGHLLDKYADKYVALIELADETVPPGVRLAVRHALASNPQAAVRIMRTVLDCEREKELYAWACRGKWI